MFRCSSKRWAARDAATRRRRDAERLRAGIAGRGARAAPLRLEPGCGAGRAPHRRSESRSNPSAAAHVARALADSFAGTSLRPPLALALDGLVEHSSLGDAE